MSAVLTRQPVVHIRFDGRSLDVRAIELGLSVQPSEADVKRAVARHLQVPGERLDDHVVDWHESGNMTIRPSAVFG